MKTVPNFIFPDDIIKLYVNKKLKKVLDISDSYLYLTVSKVRYDHKDDAIRVNFNAACNGKVLLSLVFCRNVSYDNCLGYHNKGILVVFFIGRSIPNGLYDISINDIELISRENYVDKLCRGGDYCVNFCTLNKNICSELDNSCEFNRSLNYVPLIGDIVKINGLLEKGIVCCMYMRKDKGVKKISFEICDLLNSGKFISLLIDNKRDIKLLEKNSIIVTSSICKICVLKSCKSCKLKTLKNLNISSDV